jgi:uroporphyrinogen-III synthase
VKLGLARSPKHSLSLAVLRAGWEPVFVPLTRAVESNDPPPFHVHEADALLVLSPAGARAVAPKVGPGQVVLLQGHGTFEALGAPDDAAQVAFSPRAEGLWELLRTRFPDGGRFLLVRGERSRGFLETVAAGTPWRIEAWITHREEATVPRPSLDGLDAVLALSPLQAELLADAPEGLRRFAWGERTAEAFAAAGRPAEGTCEPTAEALVAFLQSRA